MYVSPEIRKYVFTMLSLDVYIDLLVDIRLYTTYKSISAFECERRREVQHFAAMSKFSRAALNMFARIVPVFALTQLGTRNNADGVSFLEIASLQSDSFQMADVFFALQQHRLGVCVGRYSKE